MKKIAAALAALMVLALGVPAFAAELTIGGSLETSLNWGEKTVEDEWEEGWTADSTLNIDLGLVGTENRVGAHIELAPKFNGESDLKSNFIDGFDIDDISIEKAWLETNGALWNGGPDVYTRLGSLDVEHSDLVATVDKNGASVDSLPVGPAEIGGFIAWNDNTWDDVNGQRRVDGGMTVATDLDMLNGRVSAVKSGEQMAYALEGSLSPLEMATIDGFYAVDDTTGEELAQIYRVNATITPMENLKVNVGYRDLMDAIGEVDPDADEDTVVPGAFNPEYYKTSTDDDGNRTDLIGIINGLGEDGDRGIEDNAGYNVGVETTQFGVTMAASYDNPRHEAVLGANTELAGYKLGAQATFDEEDFQFTHYETELSAEKDFSIMPGIDVNGKYTATIDNERNLTHELEATSTLAVIPQLEGLEVNGGVTVAQGEDIQWNAGAKYTAPNGIKLAAGYDSVDGANVEAGMSVNF